MTESFLKPLVHEKLIELARTGPFYRIKYDPIAGKSGRTMGVLDAKNNLVEPSSIATNELSSRYGDRGYRRELKQEKISWRWELICDFSGEVASERFEALFTQQAVMLIPPQQIPPLPTVRFNLLEVDYEQPPQASSGNSRITFRFDVIVGRQ